MQRTTSSVLAAGRPAIFATVAAALLLTGWTGCSHEPAQERRPNLLLILVDALRWDHLSTYGYSRQTSPRIDALGEQGWVFENHISHAGQTVPSMVSLFVSKYPVEHGVLYRGPGHFAKKPPFFDSELTFLAEVLREAGYRTGGFVANPLLMAKFNFDQGFDHFRHKRGRGGHLTAAALAWIEESGKGSEAPFFAYLHLMDVHSPYEPPRAYRKRYPRPPGGSLINRSGLAPEASSADLAVTVSLYDAQINYVDDLVGGLLDRLQERGLLEETLVVFTADHGDEFLEHGGFGHGTSVYGELLRVPLIVFYPEVLEAGRRVEHITQHIDLAPTLLKLMGVDKPGSFRGKSVFEPAEHVYAQTASWRAAYAEGAKLILNLDRKSAELYRTEDRLDQTKLRDDALEARLRAQLDRTLAIAEARGSASRGASEEKPAAWTDEEMDQLRALGYAE